MRESRKRALASAALTRSRRPSTRPAWATVRSIKPFHPAITFSSRCGRVDAEPRLELRRRPEIEAAFLALAIGVEAGVEGAFRRGHLSKHERQRVLGDTSKRRVMRQLPGIEIGARQQGVVVEHLLEVR